MIVAGESSESDDTNKLTIHMDDTSIMIIKVLSLLTVGIIASSNRRWEKRMEKSSLVVEEEEINWIN